MRILLAVPALRTLRMSAVSVVREIAFHTLGHCLLKRNAEGKL